MMIHPRTTKTIEEYVNEHGSVIISSFSPKEIGSIVELRCNNGHDKMMEGQLFYVVREATEPEFLAQDPSLIWDPLRQYFYEVTTD
jgi:hypothetical protein